MLQHLKSSNSHLYDQSTNDDILIPGPIQGDIKGFGWSKMFLGNGWNAATGKLAGTCVLYGPDDLTTIPQDLHKDSPLVYFEGHNLRANASLEVDQDLESMALSLSGNLNSKQNVAGFNLEGSVETLKEMSANSQSINLVFQGEYVLGSHVFRYQAGRPYLTKLGQVAVAAGIKSTFESCGDHLIHQVNYGAKVLAVLKIQTANARDKALLKGHMKFSGDGIIREANGDFQAAFEEVKKNLSVRLYYAQYGGDFKKSLAVLFKKPGNLKSGDDANSSYYECNAQNIDECVYLFNNIINFLRGDFSKQFYLDAASKKIDPTSLRVINAAARPYSIPKQPMGERYGCQPSDAGCVMLYKLLAGFRSDLEHQFLVLQSYLERATYLLDESSNLLTAESKQRQRVTELRSTVQALAGGVLAALKNCYISADIKVCQESRNKAKAIVDAAHLNLAVLDVGYPLLSQFCFAVQGGKASADDLNLYDLVVRELVKLSGNQAPRCEDMDSLGKTLKELSLNDQPALGDLGILANLENLEALNFHATPLKSLAALEKLRNLKVLDLSYTSKSDFNAVYGLPKIEQLFVSGNHVEQAELDRLAASLPSLRVLDASQLKSETLNNVCSIRSTNSLLERLDVSGGKIFDKNGIVCPGMPKNPRFKLLRLNKISHFDLRADCPAERCEFE